MKPPALLDLNINIRLFSVQLIKSMEWINFFGDLRIRRIDNAKGVLERRFASERYCPFSKLINYNLSLNWSSYSFQS
jgi:hypothetical protein